MYDFHVHSNFSNDCNSEMESMVQAAIDKGIIGLSFTDHLDIDYPSSSITFEFDYFLYTKAINEIRSRYDGKIEIMSGIEVGMQPHVSKKNSEYLSGKNFDYVLGSIHAVGYKEMHDGSYAENATEKQCIMNYFRDLIDCIDNYSDFDVVGHIDVIRRYLPNGENSFKYNNYKGLLQSILIKLINSNKGIEVNTSGIRYKLSSFHPSTDILRLYRFLGGEIITLGSDAHSPDHVGYGFEDAKAILKELGYKYYTIFKERKPIFIKL